MLITQLKQRETIESLVKGKTFIINCHGCKEVFFPEHEADTLQKELSGGGNITEIVTRDYICDSDNLALQLKKFAAQLDAADTVIVFSCGVGVQTVAKYLDGKKVFAGCDTFALPGFQGVTPLEVACGQCGECYLNHTGGICPITACSKSLVNGQCGGCKDGKCEVDKNMDCGWERIYRKLEKLQKLENMTAPARLRKYGNPDEPEAGAGQ